MFQWTNCKIQHFCSRRFWTTYNDFVRKGAPADTAPAALTAPDGSTASAVKGMAGPPASLKLLRGDIEAWHVPSKTFEFSSFEAARLMWWLRGTIEIMKWMCSSSLIMSTSRRTALLQTKRHHIFEPSWDSTADAWQFLLCFVLVETVRGREEADPLRERWLEPSTSWQPAPTWAATRFRKAALWELLASTVSWMRYKSAKVGLCYESRVVEKDICCLQQPQQILIFLVQSLLAKSEVALNEVCHGSAGRCDCTGGEF